MAKTVSVFVLIAALSAILTAISFGVNEKGYGFGALGVARLTGVADASTFIPLAAIYALSGALLMLLPLRAAGFVYSNGATTLFMTTLVLMAAIAGVQAARAVFVAPGALWALADWQFAFAAAIIAIHLMLDMLRRNILLRTLSFVGFIAGATACLFWTFTV